MREHARRPKPRPSAPWNEQIDTYTGHMREQFIELAELPKGALRHWRRIEITLHAPTESGDKTFVLWSNMPREIEAATLRGTVPQATAHRRPVRAPRVGA